MFRLFSDRQKDCKRNFKGPFI